jgi:acetylornithine deacetylase/succinyl-diaminopimelate desuccinylase-like protein
MLPDEDPSQLLAVLRKIVNDATVTVDFAARDGAPRPPGGTRLNTEAFRVIEDVMKRRYGVVTLPTMGTGASDKAQMRSKGVNCYGIGPAGDVEDANKGFGGHGDQERILKSDFVEFLRAKWDIVLALAQKTGTTAP